MIPLAFLMTTVLTRSPQRMNATETEEEPSALTEDPAREKNELDEERRIKEEENQNKQRKTKRKGKGNARKPSQAQDDDATPDSVKEDVQEAVSETARDDLAAEIASNLSEEAYDPDEAPTTRMFKRRATIRQSRNKTRLVEGPVFPPAKRTASQDTASWNGSELLTFQRREQSSRLNLGFITSQLPLLLSAQT
ncbi:hypothetical protein VTN02DRAFT_4493 [Thermoascus thermophilus]